MKKLGLFLFAGVLLASSQLFAQTNEGEIKFSISYEGKDVEQLKAMLPSAYHMWFKNGNTKMVTEGGMQAAMIGDIISKSNEGFIYFVNSNTKTVNKVKQEEQKQSDVKPEVVKEKGTAVILGHTCQKYKVTIKGKDGSSDLVNYVWAAEDIDIKGTSTKSKFGAGQFMFEGIKGFPLKIELNMNQAGMTMKMVLTAVSLNLKGIDDAVFNIPSDYKVEEGLPGIMKMGGGN